MCRNRKAKKAIGRREFKESWNRWLDGWNSDKEILEKGGGNYLDVANYEPGEKRKKIMISGKSIHGPSVQISERGGNTAAGERRKL